MAADGRIEELLSSMRLTSEARRKWDLKCGGDKARCGLKYHHVFTRLGLDEMDWEGPFDSLSKSQRNILIKGELIRTYDGMSNSDKTDIKKRLGLSSFSSKWFKLLADDKKKLLNYVLGN